MEALKEYDIDGSCTIEDIEALPEGVRAELINGDIFMVGSPSLTHQRITFNLSLAIGNYIKDHDGSCVPFSAPFAVYLDEKKTKRQWVEPDVFVVCDQDKIQGDGVYGAPDWVIEVLSKSTALKDRYLKTYLYGTYGVREYWIIDPLNRETQVYIFPMDTKPLSYSFDEVICPSLYQNLKIRISDLVDI